MIVTIASFKGGVGKTTTAVHLAAYLAEKAPTLLLDGDENRSATAWAQRGSLPFRVADERQAAKLGRDFEHLVIDTQARPDHDDLKALAEGCDLLVIPSTPDILALDALILTVEALKGTPDDRSSPSKPGRRRGARHIRGARDSSVHREYSSPDRVPEGCAQGRDCR
jgi:chromosome partitioning protein